MRDFIRIHKSKVQFVALLPFRGEQLKRAKFSIECCKTVCSDWEDFCAASAEPEADLRTFKTRLMEKELFKAFGAFFDTLPVYEDIGIYERFFYRTLYGSVKDREDLFKRWINGPEGAS